MNTTSIRQLITAATILLTCASCVALSEDEGALSDEGCIIDVRPKAHQSTGPAGMGDHWVVIQYVPVDINNARTGVVFELPVVGNYATYTYAGLYSGGSPTRLLPGINTLTLEYKDGKVGFLLKDPRGNPLLDTYNDHEPPTKVSNGEPIEWPRAKQLNDLNQRKVIRILIKAYGFETGFTLHANDLLLEPRWKKIKKPWPGRVD